MVRRMPYKDPDPYGAISQYIARRRGLCPHLAQHRDRDPSATIMMARGPGRIAAHPRHRRHYGAGTLPSWRDVMRHLHTFAGRGAL
eukprot:gene15263-biopygen4952